LINVLDQKVDGIRADMSRRFVWLVGIQVAVMLAVISALLRD
jgi:hypothetical protein